MGIFSSIMDKLRHGPLSGFGRDKPAETKPGMQQTQYQPSSPQQTSTPVQPTAQPQAAPQPQAMQPIDLEAVMQGYAKSHGGGGNWRESIVDLLKMLDLDSSLEARKELARELGVNAGAHGSAEQNIALHKAVMRKIAENGGKVPQSLRD
ncbi:MAG TPA: DUF3597 domain-containing protein [Usitatibacter sp.]|jgi:hypothetical protein|nr:DUF3597 domain-containing protein [Usitatibacter sp.]